MKLKKLFAGIVAVAMMATMAIPGFAQTAPDKKSVNDGGNVTTVILTKNYDVQGGTAPADKVTITLTANANKAPDASDTVNHLPTKTTYEAEFKNAVSYTADADAKKATFEAITLKDFGFKVPGKYYYVLTENAGDKQGVLYQESSVYMTVNVKNKLNEKGEPKEVTGDEDPFEYVVALHKDSYDGEKIYDSEAFTNKYNAGSMEVTKVVKGNGSDRDKTFYFKATFTKTAGMEVKGITVKAPDAREATPLSLTFGADNTATYEFHQGHKDTTVFANIPYGMTVKVEELTGEHGTAIGGGNTLDNAYTVEYTNNEATYGKAEGNATGKVDATVTNTSTVNVDTGVILDNAPYIALLTIVAAGAVVMIMKKRRNYED